jgi:hypothetical protein
MGCARRHAVAVALACLAGAAAVAAQEPVVEYRVSERDTLIGLSERVFVSPQAWREIARLNRLPDANLIRPGQVLRVPTRRCARTRCRRATSAVGEVRWQRRAARRSAVRGCRRDRRQRPAVLALADARGCACRHPVSLRSSPAAVRVRRMPMRSVGRRRLVHRRAAHAARSVEVLVEAEVRSRWR